MSEARDAVFASIRDALGRGRGTRPAPDPPTGPAPATPADLGEPAARTARFVELLASLGADVEAVPDDAAAARWIASRVAALDAKEVAVSDATLAGQLAAGLEGVAVFDGSRDRDRLLACDLGICTAQAGVAETGTLLLFSESERHRLVSLVPPAHLAVLRARDIVGTLGDALARAQAAGDDGPPPLVSLITGPSRTADIELTLVVGVHGPRELHVVVIDD